VVRGRGARGKRIFRAVAVGARRRPSISSPVTSIVALTVAASAGAFAASAGAQDIVQCPDPTMLYAGSGSAAFTLMCTGTGFPTRSARWIAGLSKARPHAAFARGGGPRWAVDGFWAPDLERVGNRYLLYYSAQRKGDRRRCIGVATSDRPDGDFHDLGHPLVSSDPDGAIDPTLLRAHGGHYLLYKRDGNAFGQPSVIYGRRLDPSGLQVAGPRRVLLSSESGGWEGGVIEGPTTINVGRTSFLLYSGGYYLGAGYGEGEAVRHGPALGPFHRAPNNPVLIGGSDWVGTGGGSVFNAKGIFLFAYNAFPPNEHPGQRRLFLKQLGLVGGVLRPTGQVRPIPLKG
jgi:arabinan endo-1,5-alpha-L-arabinosidase